MLIQPDSIIRLIKNCPIDDSYKDTIYFKDRAEQKEYFYTTLSGINFTKQSYQRYDEGVLHIQAKADEIYNCNYLMFQNTAFGNRWFYAFVNRIEYVNNVSSKIYYEIDVIQTWMLDLTILPCFIERQHSETDGVGDNLIPESLDYGEYVEHGIPVIWGPLASQLSVVFEYQGVFDGFDKITGTYTTFGTGVYGKTYSNTNYIAISISSAENIKLIDDIINLTNILTFGGLLNVFMLPTAVVDYYSNENYDPFKTAIIDSIEIKRPTNVIDGYKPKNNKLFTFPYCVANLKADTDSGKNFAFESFYLQDENGIDYAKFNISCPLTQNANVIAYPASYRQELQPIEYAVQTSPYPICKYVTDKITDWVANNSLSIIGNAIGSIITLGSTNAAISMGANRAQEILKQYPPKIKKPKSGHRYQQRTLDKHDINTAIREGTLEALKKEIKIGNPYQMIGGVISSTLSSLQGTSATSNGGGSSIFSSALGGSITVTVKTVRNYAAKMIDDYFTMYGYAVMSINQPMFNVREHFTYIKTNGFSAHGGAPSDVISDICDIHDSGITYWKKDSKIGDYSQTNKPIKELVENG